MERQKETGLHLAVGAFDPGDLSVVRAAEEWLIEAIRSAVGWGWCSQGDATFVLETRHRTREFNGLDSLDTWAAAVGRSRSRVNAWLEVLGAPGSLMIGLFDRSVSFPRWSESMPVQGVVSWTMLSGAPEPLPAADAAIELISTAAKAMSAVGGFVDTTASGRETSYEMDQRISTFHSLPRWAEVLRGPTWLTLVTERVAQKLDQSGTPIGTAPVASLTELSDGDWRAWLCQLTPEPWHVPEEIRRRWQKFIEPVLIQGESRR